jgi:hypothetical protein
LSTEKLHVKYLGEANSKKPTVQRRYTLTHSDFTGELFLSIGDQFDKKAISGLYTKLMRDEVLAEWQKEENNFQLHIYLHVCGGLIIGRAGWRDSIFRGHLPLVLKSIIQGDKEFFQNYPNRKNSQILVHFNSSNKKYNKIETWEKIKDYL